jgi:hypothetical protein
MPKESQQLEPSELHRQIMANLDCYADRSSFECFALLMGKAQILEFVMKNLLVRYCPMKQSEMDYWTLGKVASELKSNGFRDDYVVLLKEFVRHRNYIAHEMLLNNSIFRMMAPSISERFEFRQLQQPAYELERLLVLHDWCEEHQAWGKTL